MLVLIGKMGAGVAFGTIFLLSSELFPTIVRNAGMGASSCFARFGSMLAPYVIELVSCLLIFEIGPKVTAQGSLTVKKTHLIIRLPAEC